MVVGAGSSKVDDFEGAIEFTREYLEQVNLPLGGS